MIRYHCDIEGCTSVVDGDESSGFGQGVPNEWAAVSWMGSATKENPSIKAMLKAARAVGGENKRVKGISSGSPLESMSLVLESSLHESSPVACSALICRKCLHEKLEFSRFAARSY